MNKIMTSWLNKWFNREVIILFIIKVRFFILSQRHLKTFISICYAINKFNNPIIQLLIYNGSILNVIIWIST